MLLSDQTQEFHPASDGSLVYGITRRARVDLVHQCAAISCKPVLLDQDLLDCPRVEAREPIQTGNRIDRDPSLRKMSGGPKLKTLTNSYILNATGSRVD